MYIWTDVQILHSHLLVRKKFLHKLEPYSRWLRLLRSSETRFCGCLQARLAYWWACDPWSYCANWIVFVHGSWSLSSSSVQREGWYFQFWMRYVRSLCQICFEHCGGRALRKPRYCQSVCKQGTFFRICEENAFCLTQIWCWLLAQSYAIHIRLHNKDTGFIFCFPFLTLNFNLNSTYAFNIEFGLELDFWVFHNLLVFSWCKAVLVLSRKHQISFWPNEKRELSDCRLPRGTDDRFQNLWRAPKLLSWSQIVGTKIPKGDQAVQNVSYGFWVFWNAWQSRYKISQRRELLCHVRKWYENHKVWNPNLNVSQCL